MTRLRAEVVGIGTELLLGDAIDTNSAWLCARLGELGISVHRHTNVDDDIGRIVAVLAEAAARADAVIVTGGLGPTQDDLTRAAVAALARVPLVRDQSLVDYITDYFARSGRQMPMSNLVQADIPRGARVLTPQGTAAGLAIDVDGPDGGVCTIYCLPGVPREMKDMANASVLGELTDRAGLGTTVSRVIRTAGMAESQVSELLDDLVTETTRDHQVGIAFLASKGETRVRVTATGEDRSAALTLTDPIVDRIVERLGAGVAGLDDEGPEHAVVRQLRQLGATLALAESMTAGGVAARIARVPGASAVLRGGLVVYATPAKVEVAGIDPSLLDAHGPVSAEVAGALAERARVVVGADVGLGLVGVAGPAEQGGMPVGRVYLALSTDGSASAAAPRGGTVTQPDEAAAGAAGIAVAEINLPRRSREDIQDFAVSRALDFLRRRLATMASSGVR